MKEFKVIMMDVNIWVEADSKEQARDLAVEDCEKRLGYSSPVVNIIQLS